MKALRATQQAPRKKLEANIIKIAKLLFGANDPGNFVLYTYAFFTNQQIYQRLEKVFPDLQKHYSQKQISTWLTAERLHFGSQKTQRINNVPQKGRWLWLCTAETAVTLQEKEGLFRFHCSNAVGNWVNVGYVRKSHTTESEESRIRLLQAMITRLVNRCLCTKLFASPCSSSTQPLLERDWPKPDLLAKLNGCDGDTQDLFAFLSTCTEKVRLCIIDYAGLSNDPDDVQKLL
ncbi:hypothetical protein EC973_007544, partial [Apophysomyces ossiformis]